MKDSRRNATSPVARALVTVFVALACVFVTTNSVSVAEPPSFLGEQPRPTTAKEKTQAPAQRIHITRSARVAVPSSSKQKQGLKKKQELFSEDEQLPSRATKSQPTIAPSVGMNKGTVTTILSSLGIVLGAFLILAWISRRSQPGGNNSLPKEALELLGKTVLMGKQQLQLIRIGNKLLLVNITAAGSETLTEITEPAEVERLVAMCSQNQPGSISATFRQVLGQYGGEPTRSGFIDS